MNRDQLKGKGKDIKGTVQEEVGRMSDDKSQQLKGKGEQAAGRIQEGYGNLKDKMKGRDDDTNRERQRQERGVDDL